MTRRPLERLAATMLAGVFASACATAAYSRPAPFPGAPVPASTASPSSASAEPTRASEVPVAPSDIAARLIDSATSLIGTPYRLGGQSPSTGFDCSGLMSYVAALHGIGLPRTTALQFGAGEAIDRDQIAAGDLVFFSTIGPGATHVGLVIAAGSEPRFIHAPSDGASVRIERFDTPYWQRRWVGARRILN